jgi:hypothetical protein
MKDYNPNDIKVVITLPDGTEHTVEGFASGEWIEIPAINDKYVCDCPVNYGKDCKYPEKYREEGCK